MACFLFHALYLAVKHSSMVSESPDKDCVGFISQLTSYLLLYIQEIIRSGIMRDLSLMKTV